MTAPTVIDLDLQSVRRQFPALSRKVEGQPVVYLDNPAGTQVPQRVIDRTADYWCTMNANRGGAFVTSESTDALLSESRRPAATFLHAVPRHPHAPSTARTMDCTLLVCSTCKLSGPPQDILSGRRELLERLHPYKVRPASDEGPSRWETGTQNHECLAGVLGAFEYLAELGGSDRMVRPAAEPATDPIRNHAQPRAGPPT